MSGSTTQLAGEALRHNARRAALFERIAERIYRFFLKSVWDPNEAEELAQRTLVALERSLREGLYDPERSFNTWLWLKAHTIYAQHCRERARRPAPLGEDAGARIAPRGSHEAAVDARLDAETVLRAVQERLGPEVYEVVCLFYEAGLNRLEIAEAIGRDRRTVTARLAEAHALIRRLLEGRSEP